MLRIGVTAVVISIPCLVVLSGILLIRFLRKSPSIEKTLGEVFTMIALGVLSSNYVSLLVDVGVKPTRLDKLLDRVQRGVMLLFGGGLILILVAFALTALE